MGRTCDFDLVGSETIIWGRVSLKVLNIISETLKTAISILIPASILYFGVTIIPKDNFILSFILVVLFYVSVWFVLNYTLPEWIICLIVLFFIADIGQLIVKNIYQSIPNIHYLIRSKKRRFIRR
jgi:uncharacterized membrane protein AbrB (regulator of aidB expression)